MCQMDGSCRSGTTTPYCGGSVVSTSYYGTPQQGSYQAPPTSYGSYGGSTSYGPCICGQSCTAFGAPGRCQADGSCKFGTTTPNCGGGVGGVGGGCPNNYCPTIYCSGGQTHTYDSRGCAQCPTCNPQVVVGSTTTTTVVTGGCASDSGCSPGQQCVVGQCQTNNNRRCGNSVASSASSSPIPGLSLNDYIGFSQCPSGFQCVNGYCQYCLPLPCAPCPGGNSGTTTQSNGCPGCPRCSPCDDPDDCARG